MTASDILRNEIIGKLLTISDKDYLKAINKIVEMGETENIKLTKTQKLMLEISEKDITENRLVTNYDLSKLDKEWLKSL
jgi:hypothetical protein